MCVHQKLVGVAAGYTCLHRNKLCGSLGTSAGLRPYTNVGRVLAEFVSAVDETLTSLTIAGQAE